MRHIESREKNELGMQAKQKGMKGQKKGRVAIFSLFIDEFVRTHL